MRPRDRLTAKEIQVTILVWQGLTNEDIAGVLLTSEQAVKNYLRAAFDKLGVWTRLELALYVAGHGGANGHMQVGNGLLPTGAGWSVDQAHQFSGRAASPPQANGSCKGSRDASVERPASRPSCRAGRPGVPKAIFPPSLDLSHTR